MRIRQLDADDFRIQILEEGRDKKPVWRTAHWCKTTNRLYSTSMYASLDTYNSVDTLQKAIHLLQTHQLMVAELHKKQRIEAARMQANSAVYYPDKFERESI